MRGDNNILNEDDLGKEAPLLASIPKRNPYTVPEGYFDALPSSIMDKARESNAVLKKSKLFWLFRPQWIAASLAFVIGFVYYVRQTPTPATLEVLTAQVADSAMYQHLQNNIDYVDVNSLEEELQNDNTAATVPMRTDSASGQQDIVNYLMNHNVDATDIENAL